MKKIKLLFLFILLGSMITGCTLDRIARNPKFKAKICQACGGRDTILTEKTDTLIRTIRDTLVESKTDTAFQTIQLGCDSLGNVYIKEMSSKNGRITYLNTKLKNNLLTIEALKANEKVLLSKLKEYETKLSKNRSKQVTEIHIPEPYIPWYWKWVVAPFAVIGIIAAIVGFVKYILPLILKAIRKGTIGV